MKSANQFLSIVLFLIIGLVFHSGCKNEPNQPCIHKASGVSYDSLFRLSQNLREARQDLGFYIGLPIPEEIDSSILNEMKTALDEMKTRAAAREKWLTQIHEPDLITDLLPDEEAFRFSRRGAFDTTFIVIRINKRDSAISLVTKLIQFKTDSSDKEFIYNFLANRTHLISMKEWHRFERLLEQAYFWDLADVYDKVGFDGSFWTIEGVGNPYNLGILKYHKVTKWVPLKNDFRHACDYLINLAQQHNPDIDLSYPS